MGLLTGKVAIITGAGGGIGRAHALLFAAEGAAVVVNDIGGTVEGRPAGDGYGRVMADSVVAEITAAGGQAVASYDSVAHREGVDAMLWLAQSKFGHIDILVNNAGILRDRSVLNMSEAEWDSVQAVHLRGSFLTTQAAARAMKLQGQGGRIINTTSMSGLLGNFGQANYGAAKAGVAGLTFTAAQELARHHITVNAIAPIAVTRMTEHLAMMQQMDRHAMGPQQVAPVALFLASPLASQITGKILGVHGSHVFEYRVQQSAGCSAPEDSGWTAQALAERFADICQ